MRDVPNIETNTVDKGLATPQSVERAHPTDSAVMPRVVIVGAGFGGLWAARALRNAPVQVTVGENTVAPDVSSPRFTGRIERVRTVIGSVYNSEVQGAMDMQVNTSRGTAGFARQ